jgi:putative transposase
VFIDAIVVQIRDGQVANICRDRGQPRRGRDILGLWSGTGSEGARFWMAVLTDLKNHGVNDAFFLVCVVTRAYPSASAGTLHDSTVGLVVGLLGLLYGTQGVTQTA